MVLFQILQTNREPEFYFTICESKSRVQLLFLVLLHTVLLLSVLCSTSAFLGHKTKLSLQLSSLTSLFMKYIQTQELQIGVSTGYFRFVDCFP